MTVQERNVRVDTTIDGKAKFSAFLLHSSVSNAHLLLKKLFHYYLVICVCVCVCVCVCKQNLFEIEIFCNNVKVFRFWSM